MEVVLASIGGVERGLSPQRWMRQRVSPHHGTSIPAVLPSHAITVISGSHRMWQEISQTSVVKIETIVPRWMR